MAASVATIAELQNALQAFPERHNREWLVHRSPSVHKPGSGRAIANPARQGFDCFE